MFTEKKCGCKGIRSCLLCEQQKGSLADRPKSNKVKYVYTYCPECNLCWPDDETTASVCDFPLYLGRLKVFPEFLSEEEEALAISSIDRIPWMPSQSGRRKQDFGPKVNFKKKKVKIGEFKGFPAFSENVLKKFAAVPELSDFQPVELCHLEYSPERGSSIDPHVDDFWLWGERLVTVNLSSSTILTLAPCSANTCGCSQEAVCDVFRSRPSFNGQNKGNISCSHKFQDRSLLESTFRSVSINDAIASENGDVFHDENVGDLKLPIGPIKNENFPVSSSKSKIDSYDIQHSLDAECCNNLKSYHGNVNNGSSHYSEISDLVRNENIKMCYRGHQRNSGDAILSKSNQKSSSDSSETVDCKINTMCSVFRTDSNGCSGVSIRIVLPPRSLFILAGCGRYNWYHEIKRQDVVSRRLAMTFRELTADFMDGGEESQLGKDLMLIANNFCDLE